jgi:hypothetical protein
MALRERRDLGDSSVGESAAVVARAVDALSGEGDPLIGPPLLIQHFASANPHLRKRFALKIRWAPHDPPRLRVEWGKPAEVTDASTDT